LHTVTPLGIVPTPTPGDELVGKKSLASQGNYVASKRKALNAELSKEIKKLSEADRAVAAPAAIPQNGAQAAQRTSQAGSISPGAQWTSNSSYSGNLATPTPAQSNSAANGNLYLNDNIVLQQGVGAIAGQAKAGARGAAGGEQGQKDVVLQTARGNNLRRVQQEPSLNGVAPAAAPIVLNGGLSFNTPGAMPAPIPAAGTSEASAKSEAKGLQPTGRISLAVDFPTEGQIYHFKKVKANARLDMTVTDPTVFVRWWNLAIFLLFAGALYALGLFVRRRSVARNLRSAA